MQDRPPRRITSSRDAAEAMFKAATTKPLEQPVLNKPAVPGAKEQPHVTIEGGGHFLQEDRGAVLARIVTDFIARTR